MKKMYTKYSVLNKLSNQSVCYISFMVIQFDIFWFKSTTDLNVWIILIFKLPWLMTYWVCFIIVTKLQEIHIVELHQHKSMIEQLITKECIGYLWIIFCLVLHKQIIIIIWKMVAGIAYCVLMCLLCLSLIQIGVNYTKIDIYKIHSSQKLLANYSGLHWVILANS